MKHIEINIGALCNCRCLFCTHASMGRLREPKAPVDKVLSEVDRAARDGFKSLGFLGGEITIYPPAVDVIAHARSKGFERVVVCTNGRRFEDPALLHGFIEAGVTRVALSIHSHRDDIEDRITGRKGAFGQKLAAISNCIRADEGGRLKDRFSLNSCIHGLNFKELTEMAQFFRDLGVGDMRFNFVRPEFRAVGSKRLVPRISECMPEIVRLIVLNEKKRLMTLSFGDIPLCVWPRRFLEDPARAGRYIGELRDFRTDVTMFWRDETGSVADRFNMRSQRTSTFKRHVDVCKSCALMGPCEGPWVRYVDLYGEGEFKQLEIGKA